MVRRVIQLFDVWPVVFIGPSERGVREPLTRGWQRGHDAAGELDLRATAVAMRDFPLYIGSDTGTMQVASFDKVRCSALLPVQGRGRWRFVGDHHRVIIRQVLYRTCAVAVCVEHVTKSVADITIDDVYEPRVDVAAAGGLTARSSARCVDDGADSARPEGRA